MAHRGPYRSRMLAVLGGTAALALAAAAPDGADAAAVKKLTVMKKSKTAKKAS